MQSFGFVDIPALLGEFHHRHPNVEIQMRPAPGGSAALLEEVRHGTIDIAFTAAPELPAGVETTELGTEELYLVGAKELMPARRRTVKLDTLSETTFVDFPIGWGVRGVVDRALIAAGVNRRITIEVADVSTYIQLLQARLGVALAPKSLLPANHGLEIRRVTPAITWRVVLALPSDRPTRAAARAFARLVLDPQTDRRRG